MVLDQGRRGKAQTLAKQLNWSSVTIPDLEGGDFYHMTMQSMADIANCLAPGAR